MNIVLLKFQTLTLKPEVFEIGGNFRLQNGLNLLCRVGPGGQRPKRRMPWSQLDALYDFQNLENAMFEKIAKISFLQTFKV